MANQEIPKEFDLMVLVPHEVINNGKFGDKISVETIPHKGLDKKKAVQAALKNTGYSNIAWDNAAWEFAITDEKTITNKYNFVFVAGELKVIIPASGSELEKTLESETYLYRE